MAVCNTIDIVLHIKKTQKHSVYKGLQTFIIFYQKTNVTQPNKKLDDVTYEEL